MQQVFAQVDIGDPTIFSPAQKFPDIGSLITVIVSNAFVLAGILGFLLLVFGGFSFIIGAGSGDTKRAEQGKQAITGAVIGLLVIITSYWIIQILEVITGFQLLTPSL